MQIKIKETIKEIIKPAVQSWNGKVILSNNDQIMPRMYTRFILFYQPNSNLDARKLKKSLSEVLSIFFPLAGRCQKRPNGGLDIVCSDDGVEFWEAFTDSKLADFKDLGQQHLPEFEILSPISMESSYLQQTDITDQSLVKIQLTKFECGGASLVVAMHHSAGDGASLSLFIQSWSEITRGQKISQQPCFDHSQLDARNPPSPSFEHVEYTTQFPEFPSAVPDNCAKMFQFSPADIQILKDKCKCRSFTAFEVLAGHMWKCVMKARRLNPSEESKIGMAVDGRNRLSPPLPNGYFGNVNFYACAAAAVNELVASNEVEFAVELVHNAICRVKDEEYIRSAIDWIEEKESPLQILPAFCNYLTDMAITSWSRFPLYDVDFGCGNPVFVGIPASAWNGLAILLPCNPKMEKGSFTVLLGLTQQHMNNLLSDGEFVPKEY